MTIKFIRLMALIFVPLVLAGCNEEVTYSYLIQHPSFLQKEAARCQSYDTLTKNQEAYCEMVDRAVRDVISLINEQQEDPEGFGQRILDAQIACHKRSAQTKPDFKKCEEAKVLLAVAGLNTPE